jgi:multiple antibiotic resistance protein
MIWEHTAALTRAFLFGLAAILPILNPAATAPIFLSMTDGASDSMRALLARRIALNVFLLLVGSMLVGSYVRVGGGLVVAATAWRMLSEDSSAMENREAMAQAFTSERARKTAFYPLTFPLSCGPGSIATAITVGVSLMEERVSMSLARIGGGLLAMLACALFLYLAYRYARHLLRWLGEAGSMAFMRLSAFILLCLGVQIVWDGVSELIKTL